MKKLNALIIDDDNTSLLVTVRMVEKLGMNCFTALDIDEGMLILAREKIAIVLLDYFLTDSFGGEYYLKKRKENRELLKIPVIMVSCSTNLAVMTDCFKNGCNGFLIKPIQPQLLLKAFHNCLGLALVEPDEKE